MNKLPWIILAVMALAYFGSRAEPEAATPPEYHLTVESIACENIAGIKSRALISIRNSGTTTIEYAKVAARVGPEVSATYLSPHTLHPGTIATAMAYNTAGGAEPCEVLSVTDRDGYPAVIN